jgi:hypothetical protein
MVSPIRNGFLKTQILRIVHTKLYIFQVLKLNLDECNAPQLSKQLGQYTNLTRLSLVNVGLKNLNDFPSLPNLTAVHLKVLGLYYYSYHLVVSR